MGDDGGATANKERSDETSGNERHAPVGGFMDPSGVPTPIEQRDSTTNKLSIRRSSAARPLAPSADRLARHDAPEPTSPLRRRPAGSPQSLWALADARDERVDRLGDDQREHEQMKDFRSFASWNLTGAQHDDTIRLVAGRRRKSQRHAVIGLANRHAGAGRQHRRGDDARP